MPPEVLVGACCRGKDPCHGRLGPGFDERLHQHVGRVGDAIGDHLPHIGYSLDILERVAFDKNHVRQHAALDPPHRLSQKLARPAGGHHQRVVRADAAMDHSAEVEVQAYCRQVDRRVRS